MNTDTKVHLKKRFKDYYWRSSVKAPNQPHKREFGVGTLEDKIRFRHKGFKTEKDLQQYLKTEAPYYISYSIAYYEFPENQPMAAKNWLGADLVFDLDKPMDYLSQRKLDEVRAEAASLLEFLENDFGFGRKEINVNFSGSKGYHIHVVSEDVRLLDGEARREIVDYIAGTGLDISCFIGEAEGPVGYDYDRGRLKAMKGGWSGPGRESGGWARRVYDVAEELIQSPPEKLEEIEGIGPKTAGKIASNRGRNMRLLAEGKWEILFELLGKAIQEQIYSKAVSIKDEDKQVTIDTSRLIRLPGTIHGGSGLLAARVRDLDSFNPLVDAVAFGSGEVKVRTTKDVGVFQMMEKDYGPFKAGVELGVEEYAGMYLMLKDRAEVC